MLIVLKMVTLSILTPALLLLFIKTQLNHLVYSFKTFSCAALLQQWTGTINKYTPTLNISHYLIVSTLLNLMIMMMMMTFDQSQQFDCAVY